jgi:hypothetical protein
MKKYGKVKTFRLDRKHERLLNQCFEKLHVKQDNFNAAMRDFIEIVPEKIKEMKELRQQIKDQQIEIQRPKPQLPKSEPLRHTKPISKPSTSMNTIDKDDWVVCPDKDDWVRKAVECKKCGDENFKKFSDCFKERVKNPFSDLFKCSKPKPNL